MIQNNPPSSRIPAAYTHTVLNDIVGAIYARTTIDQAFIPQDLMPMHSLKRLFEKLAHTSIMKLNEQSMNKVWIDIPDIRDNY